MVIYLTLCLLLASSTSNSLSLGKAGFSDAEYLIKTTVTYSNNGTEDWDLTEEDQTIGLFMNNTWQTVHLTEHSSPIEKRDTDEDGNPIAILQLPKRLEPGESVNYTVTYNVESKQRSIPYLDEEEAEDLTEIPAHLTDKYCVEGDTWQINDRTLQQKARTIAGNKTNVLLIVKRFVAWIWDPNNIRYDSYEGPRYPNETLSSGKGDCDDQAILLITFCRIYGIPSYLQVGCIYDYGSTTEQSSWNGTVTSVLRHIAWHGWAMVYIPPWKWLPVDLTYTWGGKETPLNAIRTGAVTSQNTIQYLNISKREYVASSRKYRDFLIENQIHIYQEDEMIRKPPKFWKEYGETWIRWFLIAMVIIACASTAVLTYIWKVERQRRRVVYLHSVRRYKQWGFPRSFG